MDDDGDWVTVSNQEDIDDACRGPRTPLFEVVVVSSFFTKHPNAATLYQVFGQPEAGKPQNIYPSPFPPAGAAQPPRALHRSGPDSQWDEAMPRWGDTPVDLHNFSNKPGHNVPGKPLTGLGDDIATGPVGFNKRLINHKDQPYQRPVGFEERASALRDFGTISKNTYSPGFSDPKRSADKTPDTKPSFRQSPSSGPKDHMSSGNLQRNDSWRVSVRKKSQKRQSTPPIVAFTPTPQNSQPQSQIAPSVLAPTPSPAPATSLMRAPVNVAAEASTKPEQSEVEAKESSMVRSQTALKYFTFLNLQRVKSEHPTADHSKGNSSLSGFVGLYITLRHAEGNYE